MNIQKFTSLKKILIVALLSIGTSHSFAQSSNGIFFQAVARDNFSNPAKDRNIYVQSTIIQNTTTGTKVLIETHKSSTDAMGVFNITIGNGQRTGGSATSIASIDWSKGPFYLNLKIAITPFSASDSWDYSKELVDMGTTSFGAVPFAFYSASSAKVDDKLNANDTTKMLAVYAKAMSVKTLETSLATKLTAADTLTMLAPYAKMSYILDSNYLKKQITSLISASDTIKYTKQSFTDSALLTKMNIFDTSIYAKQTFVDAVNYTQQKFVETSLQTKFNLADAIKYTKKAYTDSALLTKMNVFDTSIYTKQTFVDAVNYTQQKFVETSLQSKFNLADTIQYTKKAYTDSALITKLNTTGSAAGLTNFPILNQNTTGNAATATYAGNITATSNTTLTSLSNLNKVGTITNGVWNGTIIDIAHGGTGLTTAGRNGQVLTTATDGTLTWTSLTTQTATHSIGESFGGGIVFYVWDNGRHGLIASTSNQSFNSTKWGPTANYVMALRNGINAGIYNTERIISQQGAGVGTYAAMVAAHYSFNGNGWGDYGDWYLPSLYELQLLFKQKNVVGGFSNTTYVWSSTEADDKTAYTINFFSTTGTLQAESKTTLRYVRAIRSF